MKISITTIPHAAQRYPTVGDWVWSADGETLTIAVSKMGSRRFEALVAVHELVEALLCREHGISTEAVDAFDRTYSGDGEPGCAPDCPYRREHTEATVVEMHLAVAMGVDWNDYDTKVCPL
jgi:hypothetical protein